MAIVRKILDHNFPKAPSLEWNARDRVTILGL